jgi:hypothetical protein
VTDAGPLTAPNHTLEIDANLDDARENDPTLRIGQDFEAVGNPDLEGPIWWAWDEDALYFAADIRDDTHQQVNIERGFFSQDSIQFGISGPEASTWYEGELALSPAGPRVFARRFDGGQYDMTELGLLDIPAAMERETGANRTKYEVAFPWEEFDSVSSNAGEILLSLGIIDDTQSHRVAWAGGIFGGKSNTEFELVELSD